MNKPSSLEIQAGTCLQPHPPGFPSFLRHHYPHSPPPLACGSSLSPVFPTLSSFVPTSWTVPSCPSPHPLSPQRHAGPRPLPFVFYKSSGPLDSQHSDLSLGSITGGSTDVTASWGGGGGSSVSLAASFTLSSRKVIDNLLLRPPDYTLSPVLSRRPACSL